MNRRSGVLELAVLGLLHDSPLHGYELRKRLNALFGPLRAFSYGTLYPTLKDLVARRWIVEDGPAEVGATRRCPAAAPRSSTSSPPTARSGSRSCSPTPGRRRGKTRISASTLPFLDGPSPIRDYASWKAAGRGWRSDGWVCARR